jgi:hypothetical protein
MVISSISTSNRNLACFHVVGRPQNTRAAKRSRIESPDDESSLQSDSESE